ncbi:MAG: hypothetical protein Q8Q10_01410 [bacterium]|nr:hypothetical protein [bacterium]
MAVECIGDNYYQTKRAKRPAVAGSFPSPVPARLARLDVEAGRKLQRGE